MRAVIECNSRGVSERIVRRCRVECRSQIPHRSLSKENAPTAPLRPAKGSSLILQSTSLFAAAKRGQKTPHAPSDWFGVPKPDPTEGFSFGAAVVYPRPTVITVQKAAKPAANGIIYFDRRFDSAWVRSRSTSSIRVESRFPSAAARRSATSIVGTRLPRSSRPMYVW